MVTGANISALGQREPLHTPAAQVGVSIGQTRPQRPQLEGSLLVSMLQPLAGTPSQLASGGMQSIADEHMLFTHIALTQSPASMHTLPPGHLGQVIPPQSTSDSWPFLIRSSQRASRHLRLTQVPLSQSGPSLQCLPPAQGEQKPPQSTSVSSPSWAPLEQLAGLAFLSGLAPPSFRPTGIDPQAASDKQRHRQKQRPSNEPWRDMVVAPFVLAATPSNGCRGGGGFMGPRVRRGPLERDSAPRGTSRHTVV